MNKAILGGAVVGAALVALVPFISSATPASCSISFAPSSAAVGTFQSEVGTFVGNSVSGSFTTNLFVQAGSNTYTLSLPSSAKCSGVVVGQ